MIEHINELFRPTGSVGFYKSKVGFQNYIKNTYIDTGKIIAFDKTISDDGLIKKHAKIFKDSAAEEEFSSDPIVKKDTIETAKYNILNGIKRNFWRRIVE